MDTIKKRYFKNCVVVDYIFSLIVFQKFDDSWGEWIDVTSEQELQNRDKIKVLVQARENLTSASKLNDTRVKGNEIIEYTITISLLI